MAEQCFFGESVIVSILVAPSVLAGWFGASQAQGGNPADGELPLSAPASLLLALPSLLVAAATLGGGVAAPSPLPHLTNSPPLLFILPLLYPS